jgi:hypothetical protein
MRKFTTEQRPLACLMAGDPVMFDWGVSRLTRIVEESDGRFTLHSESQPAVTLHASNWPDVVTGFTKEYQAAYPHERFVARLTPCPACGVPCDPTYIPPPRVPLSVRCACCCQ